MSFVCERQILEPVLAPISPQRTANTSMPKILVLILLAHKGMLRNISFLEIVDDYLLEAVAYHPVNLEVVLLEADVHYKIH